MSNETHYINFSNKTIQLIMKFEGEDYHTASVKIMLEGKEGNTINESVTIPVSRLFDISFLIGMCIRRIALQYEVEIQEMQGRIAKGTHPLKGGGDGKEDKAK